MTYNLHCENYISCGIVVPHCKVFRKKTRIHFIFLFYRRIQSFPPFQWFGGERLAILEDSPLKKQDT